ncbi:MAG: phage capsid protein [Pseudomonas orientalis]|nr:phage capsid protein [Pseudomonas orientalis]
MASKSKKFRIATEGATTDGRVIERSWIEQMAANYNPAKYGARVNLEHFKGVLPDSPFKRYGDVLSLTAETVDDNKLGLFAVIDPTDELVAMTKARQKIYTSMEVHPSFADTNEAYLVGLAVTDDPASLGTEMLQFSASAQSSPLAARKQSKDTLFSEAIEFTLELDAVTPNDDGKTLFSKVKELLGVKSKTDNANFADHGQAIEIIAESQRDLLGRFSAVSDLEKKVTQLSADLENETGALDALIKQLNFTPDNSPNRPSATGSKVAVTTDC